MERIGDTNNIALWLDMGLGKTAITLNAIMDLKFNRFLVNKVLVIAPMEVAKATWQEQAAQWDQTKSLRISTILGTAEKRRKAAEADADLYIINRENVAWLVDIFRSDWPFDMVVIDEASSFKSHKAKRFKSLKSILPHVSRLVELTGTPAPNGYLDLWAQVYLLDKGKRLGPNITAYRDRYFNPDKRSLTQIFSWKLKHGADAAIKRVLSDICISMKSSDYLELPDMLIHDVPVILSGEARGRYERLERDLLLEVDETEIDAGSAAVLSNKLLQLCGGSVYDENGEAVEIHGNKIDAFFELVDSLNGQPALVFYNFRHEIDRLLAKVPKGLRAVVYKGPEDAKQWNEGKIDLLFAHPASCAYGLNLQKGGHNIIWFGLNWSLELYEQANKRLHRNGQEHPVVIHRLIVKDSADEDVRDALEGKKDTQNSLLASLKARIEKVKDKKG